jgi:hypothetical protein
VQVLLPPYSLPATDFSTDRRENANLNFPGKRWVVDSVLNDPSCLLIFAYACGSCSLGCATEEDGDDIHPVESSLKLLTVLNSTQIAIFRRRVGLGFIIPPDLILR